MGVPDVSAKTMSMMQINRNLLGTKVEFDTKPSFLNVALQVIESLQCEIFLFVIAVSVHVVLFGRNNILLRGQMRGGPKAVRCRKDVTITTVNPKPACNAATGNQKDPSSMSLQTPVPISQRLNQPQRRTPNPLAQTCVQLVGASENLQTGKTDSCKLRFALEAEIRRYLGVGEAQAVSSATLDMAAEALETMPWKQNGIGCAGKQNGIGSSASVVLEAFRDVLGTRTIMESDRLMETMVFLYGSTTGSDAFDSFVAELDTNAAHPLSIGVREAILKGALKKGDFHDSIRRFESIRKDWLASHSARQCLIQQMGRVAAQQSNMPELLSVLPGIRLSCETVNVLLATATECGDAASFDTVTRLGREAGVHFNTVTYCRLLAEARSIADMERLLSEAAEKGPSTRGVLEKAAEMAVDRADSQLGDAVMRCFPTSRSEIEQRCMGAVAALLRLPAALASRNGQNKNEVHKDVLRLYEEHFADLDFSVNGPAEAVLLDAALACERADIVAKVMEAANESSRAATVKRVGASGRLAEVCRVLGTSTSIPICRRHAWLEGAVSGRDTKLALKIFQEAESLGQLDAVMYTAMIRAHIENHDARKARSLVKAMKQSGFYLAECNQNELVESVVKCCPDQLYGLLEEIKSCGLKVNNSMAVEILKSVGQKPRSCDVERLVALLEEIAEEMDESVLCMIIEACVRAGRADLLELPLKRHWVDRKLPARSTHTYGSVIRAYGCLQDVDSVWATWRQMRKRHFTATSVSIGCMVEALVTNGLPEAGYELIRELLQDESVRPLVNAVTYCSVLKGFSHQKRFDRTWSVYLEMLQERMEFSIVTFNTLVDACARCGEMSYVPELLNEMVRQKIEPNLITYSAILKGYCQESRLEKAFELLESMKRTTSFVPDEIMFNSLLDGCARKGLYDKGLQVLADMEQAGLKPSNYTLSLLVKLAGRGRQLESAFRFVEDMPRKFHFQPNVHVYANLIQACLQHKALCRALGVLDKMAKERLRPDARIYGLVIRACVSAGQLQDAEGLVRTACGLKNGHRFFSLETAKRAGSSASGNIFALQNVSELAAPMLTELLEALAKADERVAVDLARDLQNVPRVQMDPRIKLRLLTKRRLDHRAAPM